MLARRCSGTPRWARGCKQSHLLRSHSLHQSCLQCVRLGFPLAMPARNFPIAGPSCPRRHTESHVCNAIKSATAPDAEAPALASPLMPGPCLSSFLIDVYKVRLSKAVSTAIPSATAQLSPFPRGVVATHHIPVMSWICSLWSHPQRLISYLTNGMAGCDKHYTIVVDCSCYFS
jgi:hypothetical protein